MEEKLPFTEEELQEIRSYADVQEQIGFSFLGDVVTNPWVDLTGRHILNDVQAISDYGYDNVLSFCQAVQELLTKAREENTMHYLEQLDIKIQQASAREDTDEVEHLEDDIWDYIRESSEIDDVIPEVEQDSEGTYADCILLVSNEIRKEFADRINRNPEDIYKLYVKAYGDDYAKLEAEVNRPDGDLDTVLIPVSAVETAVFADMAAVYIAKEKNMSISHFLKDEEPPKKRNENEMER